MTKSNQETEQDQGYRQRALAAYHEAGHSVCCVALGGRVQQAMLGDTPRVEYDDYLESHRPALAYAGPWAEARFGRLDVQRVLAGTSDDDELREVGGPAAATGVATLLERCWPAIRTVAHKLFDLGHVGHADVCAALGLPNADQGGPDSAALANIRAGLRSVRPVRGDLS